VSSADPGLAELAPWCAREGLELTDAQLQSLANYVKSLRFWGDKVALLGRGESARLSDKHLPDCLFAATRCPPSGRFADLGSGAGLPGIPVAIARPGATIDLIEARGKKASFLADATKDLHNAQVVNRRIEDLQVTYEIALARALAPLPRLLELVRPTLEAGGQLLAMKSSAYADELAECDLGKTGFDLVEPVEYELPSGEPRVLLILVAV